MALSVSVPTLPFSQSILTLTRTGLNLRSYFSAMRILHSSLTPFFVFSVCCGMARMGSGLVSVWVHITTQRGGGKGALYRLTIDSYFFSYFTPAFSSWVKGRSPDARGSPGEQVFVVIYATYFKQSDWRRRPKW